jgi:hypothetical protein
MFSSNRRGGTIRARPGTIAFGKEYCKLQKAAIFVANP